MEKLRAEADTAVARAEEAEAKNKKLEQTLLEKEQDLSSKTHQLSVLEGELEKAESKLAEAKGAHDENDISKTTNDGLNRKIQLLEEELDNAEKNLKDTVERSVCSRRSRWSCISDYCASRLRQVDLKAEHFERQVQRLEQERDQWEKKYEVQSCRDLHYHVSLTSSYRKRRRSTALRKPSWTSLFPLWKACEHQTVSDVTQTQLSDLSYPTASCILFPSSEFAIKVESEVIHATIQA